MQCTTCGVPQGTLRSLQGLRHTDFFLWTFFPVKTRFRRNKNQDSCEKYGTGTGITGIRRIPAGKCNLAVDIIFKMSSMSEDSLKSFMKNFSQQGLAKIPHENIRTVATQMDGVAERLADSNVLRSEALTQYITGFTICSVPEFKQVFMARLTQITYLDAIGDSILSSMSSSNVLKAISEVSTAARAIYDHLHAGNRWNLPGKPGLHATIVNSCDNCGSPDHYSTTCPEPYDADKCKKAREARAHARKEDNGGRGSCGGRGGRGGGAGRGGDRAPWGDDSARKSTAAGIMEFEGTWKMHCSKCDGDGWNETHTTKYHDDQKRNAATFQLPRTHPWYLYSGQVWSAAGVGTIVTLPSASATGSEAAGSEGSILSSLTRLVDRTMTGTDSSEMSSFLSEMRNVLGN